MVQTTNPKGASKDEVASIIPWLQVRVLPVLFLFLTANSIRGRSRAGRCDRRAHRAITLGRTGCRLAIEVLGGGWQRRQFFKFNFASLRNEILYQSRALQTEYVPNNRDLAIPCPADAIIENHREQCCAVACPSMLLWDFVLRSWWLCVRLSLLSEAQPRNTSPSFRVASKRNPLKMTRNDAPMSAAMAAPREAQPLKVRTTNRAITNSEKKMFWRMTASVRRE